MALAVVLMLVISSVVIPLAALHVMRKRRRPPIALDLRRADQAEQEGPYDASAALDAVFDAASIPSPLPPHDLGQ